MKTPVSSRLNKLEDPNDTCASDCLLATPVTIFISDKDLQDLETPSPFAKTNIDQTAAELSTQYPLHTSLSSFKETDTSGIYSSSEETTDLSNTTLQSLVSSSDHNKSKKNSTMSSVSPLVGYDNTVAGSTINKTQGVVNYDNTAVENVSNQTLYNETGVKSPGTLVPYDKSIAVISNHSSTKAPVLVPYDKSSMTFVHDDFSSENEKTLPSFSETFNKKTHSLVPYDKTSTTIIQNPDTPNLVGYDTTIVSNLNQSEMKTSLNLVPYETTVPHETPVAVNKTANRSVNLVPYETTLVHKTPATGNTIKNCNINLVPYETTILHKTPSTGNRSAKGSARAELSFVEGPSPVVLNDPRCNKTSFMTDGSTFDEMSAFENPNATGMMVGNVHEVIVNDLISFMTFICLVKIFSSSFSIGRQFFLFILLF